MIFIKDESIFNLLQFNILLSPFPISGKFIPQGGAPQHSILPVAGSRPVLSRPVPIAIRSYREPFFIFLPFSFRKAFQELCSK